LLPVLSRTARIAADQQAEWFINRMADLGAAQLRPSASRRSRSAQADQGLCQETDIEIDCYAWLFGLVGAGAKIAREKLLTSIRIAKLAGTNFVRTRYGRLNMDTLVLPWIAAG
jgi:hypothetical protein